MKITALVARYILGIAFLVFGLNGFLHFIPLPPPKGALALQYLTALGTSGYMVPVFALQLASAILLLAAGSSLWRWSCSGRCSSTSCSSTS